MEEIDAALKAGTSPMVQVWMNWMIIIFLTSILFIWKRRTARYALLVILLTMPIALLIWKQTQNVHLFGIAHLLLWLPLAIYIYFFEIKTNDSGLSLKQRLKSPFFIWLCLLLITILVSLVFDVRDIYLVFSGAK